jgi:tetratricopeptide (TPR) repeat protein
VGRAALACALVVLSAACRAKEGGSAPPASGPAAEGRRLLESGQLDAAAAKLGEAGEDPEALYDLGRVWAKKAEQAPLPTPLPPPQPVPKGWEPPPPPEFKAEELQAVASFEKALAARPDHGPAHFALAQLLAPHAIRQHERLAEASRVTGRRGAKAKAAPPVLPDTAGVDLAPARLVRSFEVALRAEPRIEGALPALTRFAERTGDLEATDRAYQEEIRRAGPNRESAGPLVRYGDFLLKAKKDPGGAVEQYRQALIWRPDDDAARAKLADIYIAMGIEQFAQQRYATSEARFADATRYLTDPTSPQALTVKEYKARLAAIRR